LEVRLRKRESLTFMNWFSEAEIAHAPGGVTLSREQGAFAQTLGGSTPNLTIDFRTREEFMRGNRHARV
jgi:hypothetical protein